MRALIATAFSLVGIASCTEILGINGTHEPIGVAVCVCTNETERLGSNPARCQETVRRKLLAADPAVTSAWMAKYEELDCNSCTRLPACLSIAPLCATAREGCTTNADCCDGLGCDVDGKCTACSGAGQACSASQPCCGVDFACDVSGTCSQCATKGAACADSRSCCGFGQVDVYCNKAPGDQMGVCAEELGCKHTGEPCDEPSECCGSDFAIPDPLDATKMVAAGSCEVQGGNKQCVERCDPQNPENCLGCCGAKYARINPDEAEFVCYGDASCSPAACVVRDNNQGGGGAGPIDATKTKCPEGTLCAPSCPPPGILCTNVCQ